MKTFLVLFVVVCAPFVWFIVKMLRYTNRTIGDESPLYSRQSYHFSAYDYFCQFVKILLAVVFVQMLLLVQVMTKEAIRLNDPLLLPFAFCFAGFAGYLLFIFYVDWQYWAITRDVHITLDPHEPSITVSNPEQTHWLTPSNVIRIEHHLRKTENSKDPLGGYGYFCFYDSAGQTVQLNNVFLIHVEFLERFFSDVPQTIIWHTIPWPTNSVEKTGLWKFMTRT